MLYRSAITATAVAATLLMSVAGAAAHDETKYPDLRGQWTASSTFPNWAGSDQKRINLAITGDELKYVHPTPSGGGPAAPVAWKRVK
jgi:hypothetical protein